MKTNIHYDNISFNFFSDKFVEKITTNILCRIFFFENRVSCEIA